MFGQPTKEKSNVYEMNFDQFKEMMFCQDFDFIIDNEIEEAQQSEYLGIGDRKEPM